MLLYRLNNGTYVVGKPDPSGNGKTVPMKWTNRTQADSYARGFGPGAAQVYQSRIGNVFFVGPPQVA